MFFTHPSLVTINMKYNSNHQETWVVNELPPRKFSSLDRLPTATLEQGDIITFVQLPKDHTREEELSKYVYAPYIPVNLKPVVLSPSVRSYPLLDIELRLKIASLEKCLGKTIDRDMKTSDIYETINVSIVDEERKSSVAWYLEEINKMHVDQYLYNSDFTTRKLDNKLDLLAKIYNLYGRTCIHVKNEKTMFNDIPPNNNYSDGIYHCVTLSATEFECISNYTARHLVIGLKPLKLFNLREKSISTLGRVCEWALIKLAK